jgi:hypothetical protein
MDDLSVAQARKREQSENIGQEPQHLSAPTTRRSPAAWAGSRTAYIGSPPKIM